MASTACFFHNRRAIRLSSRRRTRQSSRSTRFVVTSSLLCIVGLLLHIPLPVVEGQPHVKRIPYVGISGEMIGCEPFLDALKTLKQVERGRKGRRRLGGHAFSFTSVTISVRA